MWKCSPSEPQTWSRSGQIVSSSLLALDIGIVRISRKSFIFLGRFAQKRLCSIALDNISDDRSSGTCALEVYSLEDQIPKKIVESCCKAWFSRTTHHTFTSNAKSLSTLPMVLNQLANRNILQSGLAPRCNLLGLEASQTWDFKSHHKQLPTAEGWDQ